MGSKRRPTEYHINLGRIPEVDEEGENPEADLETQHIIDQAFDNALRPTDPEVTSLITDFWGSSSQNAALEAEEQQTLGTDHSVYTEQQGTSKGGSMTTDQSFGGHPASDDTPRPDETGRFPMLRSNNGRTPPRRRQTERGQKPLPPSPPPRPTSGRRPTIKAPRPRQSLNRPTSGRHPTADTRQTRPLSPQARAADAKAKRDADKKSTPSTRWKQGPTVQSQGPAKKRPSERRPKFEDTGLIDITDGKRLKSTGIYENPYGFTQTDVIKVEDEAFAEERRKREDAEAQRQRATAESEQFKAVAQEIGMEREELERHAIKLRKELEKERIARAQLEIEVRKARATAEQEKTSAEEIRSQAKQTRAFNEVKVRDVAAQLVESKKTRAERDLEATRNKLAEIKAELTSARDELSEQENSAKRSKARMEEAIRESESTINRARRAEQAQTDTEAELKKEKRLHLQTQTLLKQIARIMELDEDAVHPAAEILIKQAEELIKAKHDLEDANALNAKIFEALRKELKKYKILLRESKEIKAENAHHRDFASRIKAKLSGNTHPQTEPSEDPTHN